MFGIVLSALNAILGWIFRGVVIKFVILTALYYVITFIVSEVLSLLDISPVEGLEASINSLGASILFFMGVFKLEVGIPLILGAMLTAFMIRRLPFIG